MVIPFLLKKRRKGISSNLSTDMVSQLENEVVCITTHLLHNSQKHNNVWDNKAYFQIAKTQYTSSLSLANRS